MNDAENAQHHQEDQRDRRKIGLFVLWHRLIPSMHAVVVAQIHHGIASNATHTKQ